MRYFGRSGDDVIDGRHKIFFLGGVEGVSTRVDGPATGDGVRKRFVPEGLRGGGVLWITLPSAQRGLDE